MGEKCDCGVSQKKAVAGEIIKLCGYKAYIMVLFLMSVNH
jgi:hypothetical protein